MYVPSEVALTSGVGRHSDGLASFELALRDAGVEAYNLVGVSSIAPPEADVVSLERARRSLDEGQVVHAVLGRAETLDGVASAAVGMARPPEGHGYFVEKAGVDGRRPREGDAVALAVELAGSDHETREEHVEAEGDGERYTTAVSVGVLVP
ncbi:MAG: pyruvoyl-dependent arginine decarboxylase [Halobacteriales archaeon]